MAVSRAPAVAGGTGLGVDGSQSVLARGGELAGPGEGLNAANVAGYSVPTVAPSIAGPGEGTTQPAYGGVGTSASENRVSVEKAPALYVDEKRLLKWLDLYRETPGELQFIEESALHDLMQRYGFMRPEHERLIIEGPKLHRSALPGSK
jgi:hypothetical protein